MSSKVTKLTRIVSDLDEIMLYMDISKICDVSIGESESATNKGITTEIINSGHKSKKHKSKKSKRKQK